MLCCFGLSEEVMKNGVEDADALSNALGSNSLFKVTFILFFLGRKILIIIIKEISVLSHLFLVTHFAKISTYLHKDC